MCEVNAACPICRGNLDPYERSCIQVGGVHRRTYSCPCGADVVVNIRDSVPTAAWLLIKE